MTTGTPDARLGGITLAPGAVHGYSGDDLTSSSAAFARGEVPGFGAGNPDPAPVVELRVHGVGGAAPADNLESPATVQVSGDGRAGFYRAWYPGGAARPADGVREAYCWGRINYAGWVSALWLLFVCFAFVNVAHWSLPDESGRGTVGRAVLRLLGLVLTVAMIGTTAYLTTDLVAWQAADPHRMALWSWLKWFAASGPGVRHALALYVVLFVLAGLWWLSYRTTRDHEGWTAGEGAEPHPDWPLTRPQFWHGERTLVRQRHCHVMAGCAVVILVAVLPHSAWHGARYTAMAVAALFALAAAGLAVSAWSDRVSRAGREAATLDRLAAGLAIGAVVAAVGISTAQFWWADYDTTPTSLPGDGALQVIVCGVEGLLVLVLLAVTWRRPSRRPADVIGLGLVAPVLALLACTVSTIFGGALVLTAANLLGKPVPFLTGAVRTSSNALFLVPPTVYAGGTGFLTAVAAAVVVGIALFAVSRLQARRFRNGPGESVGAVYRAARAVVDPPAPTAAAEKSVARVWATARVTDHAAAVLTAVTVPTALVVTAHLLFLQWRHSTPWLLTLASLGGSLAVLATGGFVVQLRAAITSSAARKRFSFFWDVVTFWPRACHPFAPPCYAERSIPELVTRIRRIVGDEIRGPTDPAARQQSAERVAGGRPSLRERHAAVLLSGYSQGSPISVAVVAQLPAEVREQVALLTLAAPVRRLYGRTFPAYFGPTQLGVLRARLGGQTATLRWRNVVRRSDYIGGWSSADAAVRALVDHEIMDPPVLWADDDATPPPSHLHSDWFPDPQTRPHAAWLVDSLCPVAVDADAGTDDG